MILSLVDMIREPFELPNWSFKLVMVILSVGLIIAVILSWIYDIHPEEGMVKTEPSDKIKTEAVPRSYKGWKVASYISFVVIIGLIVLNVIPRSDQRAILDKSIAVLQFHNDSPDQENMFIISNCMVSILDNLSKIEDLRVHSRESTIIYLDNPKPPKEIARELNVGFLLDGHGQKIDHRFYLTVQLLDASGKIIWSKPYDRIIEKPEDQIDILIEVSRMVASEIKATIAPEEMQLIEKIATTNNVAWELYQKGIDEYWKNRSFVDENPEALKGAEDRFWYALDYDSTFAEAYAGLARVFYDINRGSESYFSEDFLDTVLILADKALSFDPQLSDAYSIKGDYYYEKGMGEQALLSYNNALELNPNDWSAYWGKAYLFHYDDLVQAIDNFNQAISRHHGPVRLSMLRSLAADYYAAGIIDLGDSCTMKAFRVSGDSVDYYLDQANKYWILGENEKALEITIKAYLKDSANIEYFNLASVYTNAGQFEEAVSYWDRHLELSEASGWMNLNNMHRIGYAYFMGGDKEQGTYYLNIQKEYCENAISLGRWLASTLYLNYDLAGVYAFLGDREKAYGNLRIFNQRDKMPLWMNSLIKYDPLFDNIRAEPEFQQIVRDVEIKYQAEHERVRQWLEKNDML